MSNVQGITALKELLFEEENERFHELSEQIKATSQEIDQKLANREIPESEFKDILSRIIKVMPEKLGPTITATLKTQIKESRDDVVQALFPIIGQMIKKYIQQEIQLLSDRIDKQFETTFSMHHLGLRFKALFTNVPYSQLVLKEGHPPEIQQIFLIEEGSGILKASYSKSQSFDQDMMSGMLTAIKSFVEDAMDTNSENLEMISYDLHKIYVQSFNKYYIAVVLSGTIDTAFKRKLDDRIVQFVNEIIQKKGSSEQRELSHKISQYFNEI